MSPTALGALRRTKIIATLGPASDAPGAIEALIAAGVNIVRRALQTPLRQIAENAGEDGSVVVDEALGKKPNEGYNALTGAAVKLGRWDHYLAMRQGLIEFNQRHRDLLSNDLGAVAGLMFDLGMERYPLPPAEGDAKATDAWAKDLAAVREETAAFAKQLDKNRVSDEGHTEVQGWLRDLGLALGFSVWIASNDQSRPYGGGRLADGCLTVLPQALQNEGADAVRLIDVIWLERESGAVVAAFEVEHTTSIYSGIVRLLDLALSGGAAQRHHLFLVAPDEREADVRQQVLRPAFSQVRELNIRYLPYGELRQHREAIARFGAGIKPVEAIARMF